MSLDTPVVLLIYNRPHLTKLVFEAIRQARPKSLFVVADGPRADRPGDAAQVDAARSVIQAIDWPCDLRRDYAPRNLGCRARVSSGLNWVFDNVEEAIVLEDDCLPSASFFPFCREILDRYRDDRRIMAVSGMFPLPRYRLPQYSHFFSKNFSPWGWATWRRAWKHFDLEMTTWPEFQASGAMQERADTPAEAEYRAAAFENAYRGLIDSWAFPWFYACWSQSGLVVRPTVNLIRNLGFGPGATHTTAANDPSAGLLLHDLGPLVHPTLVVRDKQTDMDLFRLHLTAESPADIRAEPAGGAHVEAGCVDLRLRYLEDRIIRQYAELSAKEGVIRGLVRRRAHRPAEIVKRAIRKVTGLCSRAGERQMPGSPVSEARVVRAPADPCCSSPNLHSPVLRIVLGAGDSSFEGWQSTDRSTLDVLRRADFARCCQTETCEAFLAEHVWEHLTDQEGDIALRNCFEFLKPGGRLRLAVPDACHPDPAYQEWVRPGGTGPGADDHHAFYNYATLAEKLTKAGFEAVPLEYWDERGRFHYRPWVWADGPIRRSCRHDARNQSRPYSYTSLIVDAMKPVADRYGRPGDSSLPAHSHKLSARLELAASSAFPLRS